MEGSEYTIHVNFAPVAEIVVDDLVVDVPDLGGHFVVPLDDAEKAAGAVDVPLSVTSEAGETVCQRDYRGVGTCYTPMSETTTEMLFAAATEPPPADPQTGIGLSAGTPVQLAVTGPPPPGMTCHAYGDLPGDCTCAIESCVSTDAAYYLLGGTYYPCDGLDCEAAAAAVVSACGCYQ